MSPCNTRHGLFFDLRPKVGTWANPYIWVRHRRRPAGQKLSPKWLLMFIERPQRSRWLRDGWYRQGPPARTPSGNTWAILRP